MAVTTNTSELQLHFLGDDDVVDEIVNIAGPGSKKKTAPLSIIIEKESDEDCVQTDEYHKSVGMKKECMQSAICGGGRSLFKYKLRKRTEDKACKVFADESVKESTVDGPSTGFRKRKVIAVQGRDTENTLNDRTPLDSPRRRKVLLSASGSGESDRHEELNDANPLKKIDMSKLWVEFFESYQAKMKSSSDLIDFLRKNNLEEKEFTINSCTEYVKNQQERCILYETYRGRFDRWLYELREGYNLLFYGLGSKRIILEQFRSVMLQCCAHLVVNGYFPNISIKSIVNNISQDILKLSSSPRNPIDQCNLIKQDLEASSKDLFVIIHNIDGTMLRNEKAQTILSLLAQCPKIHIIASIDHLNATILWDQTQANRFNWVFYDVTTFEPYVDEISSESLLSIQQKQLVTMSSLNHIFASLTPNARKIFQLIAEYQLERNNDTGYLGIPFQEYYYKCREKFLVNSESTLKAHLAEFFDHRLIKSRKGSDGVDLLSVPLDLSVLSDFMEANCNPRT